MAKRRVGHKPLLGGRIAINSVVEDPASTKKQRFGWSYDESPSIQAFQRTSLHVKSRRASHSWRHAWHFVSPHGVLDETGSRATRDHSDAGWHNAERHCHRDLAVGSHSGR